jgi:hypothetical protein
VLVEQPSLASIEGYSMRSYFHLVNSHEFIADNTGVEVPALATAQIFALQAIEDIREEAVQLGSSR